MAPISALTTSAASVGGDVRLTGYCPQDSQPLGCDLDTVLTKEVSGVLGHGDSVDQCLD